MHFSAGFRISPNATSTHLHSKRAEAPQLDPMTMRQRCNDFIEDGVNRLGDIALKQMCVLTRDIVDQLRFNHEEPLKRPKDFFPEWLEKSTTEIVRWLGNGLNPLFFDFRKCLILRVGFRREAAYRQPDQLCHEVTQSRSHTPGRKNFGKFSKRCSAFWQAEQC
jgi:hypothetical protein